MTIGFGCLCGDGVVLAADTQLTALGYHKTYARKIQKLYGDGYMDVAVTYAGSPVFARDFADSLHGEILSAGESTYSLTAKAMISRVLSKYTESDVNNNHMLIGVRTEVEGAAALFRTSGYSVSYHGLGDDPVFIGAGDSSALVLALPLLSSLGIVNMRHAAIVAFILVEIAKKYIDGCGGETDILMLPVKGDAEFLSAGVMGEMYNIFSGIDTAIAKACYRILTPCAKAERAKAINDLSEELEINGGLLENVFTLQGPQTSKDSQ